MKNSKQLERYFKGAANHRRIDILLAVQNNPGITLDGIATALNANFKTISQHSGTLVRCGLLNKVYQGASVTHLLSPYGKAFLKFMQSF
jgi:predicted transcriptional regulator